MDEARKLLDSLMGSHRNVDRKEAKAKKGQNFKEDNICKLYLLGFCPQHEDLFHSTKRDIGKCHKVHSEAMKLEFEAHPDREYYQHEYERQLRCYLEDLVRGADEWVARERRNIQVANQQIEESGPNEIAKAEIRKLNEQAASLFAEAENLAEAGNFDESKVKLELAEEVKKRASDWEEKARTVRTEDVCEVCGSRMESGDPSKAKFRHEDGKIHAGYVKIRQWLVDVRQRLREREERGEAEDVRRGEREGRDRELRDRDAKERDPRDRDRCRNGSGTKAEAGRRDAERERHRGRDRERARAHESERGSAGSAEREPLVVEAERAREAERSAEGEQRCRARDRLRVEHERGGRGGRAGRDSRERGGGWARHEAGREKDRATERADRCPERSRSRAAAYNHTAEYERGRDSAYDRACGYGYGHGYER
eukprot:CAMPEP_0171115172 /NCGR_PEP_ID=MMETSP0766_2-20121228/87135_1 /TAXON_ID=439317 /ORGANISM="Gambierdiscus australes, Strain CAWD 149" /LENGTH=425 /DNA_ID=CAMNT_0011577509 /DNA_START=94 /DNA_END=1368 /DNA_ORIENTATION=+